MAFCKIKEILDFEKQYYRRSDIKIELENAEIILGEYSEEKMQKFQTIVMKKTK